MSQRRTKRSTEHVTVEQIHRCLKHGQLTTRQVCERLSLTPGHAGKLLRACPGVHRGKLGAQRYLWSLEATTQ